MEDRRKAADGKEIWVIKAGFPDTPAKKNWSDYVFAHSLKKYLERLGHYVVVESCDEWFNEAAADVVVVLRGTKRYIPDRAPDGRIYIMWNLSHPSQITDEEYSAYDLVCIGSASFGKKVRDRIRVPVKILLICADTEIFYPDSDSGREKEYDWVFVGNSRHMERKCVTWSIEHGIPLKVWGADWEKFMPDSTKYVVAENMPNDMLPELYRNAKVTVCDHYEDMIENGFINTRILEAFACGLPVLSDDSGVLKEMFGDAILCYRDEAEFVEQAEKMTREYATVKEKVQKLWPVIDEKYSFRACARQLDGFAREVREYRESCRAQVRTFAGVDRGENVPGTLAQVFQNFCELFHALTLTGLELPEDNTREKEQRGGSAQDISYDHLTELLQNLREAYRQLTWIEQQAFQELQGRERLLFELFARPGAGAPGAESDTCRPSVYEELEKVKNNLEGAKEELEKLKSEKDELYHKLRVTAGEKSALNQKLKRAYQEKSEINQKLQLTYQEKSEINRKLQITYKEKYDRGLKIKSLEKELASVKASRTYRLARIIGFPVRFLRKIMKRAKE